VYKELERPLTQAESKPGEAARIRRIIRFVLPPAARVAVITEGRHALLNLEGLQTWPIPRNKDGVYSGPFPANDGDAIAEVERARADGAQFLLIPKSAFWWLDYYDGLRRHLASAYRVAFRDSHSCMVIALHHEVDPPDQMPADGLPFPPPEMMAMTTGSFSARTFWDSGKITRPWIRQTLFANELQFASFDEILDFGCGCGRVMRHLEALRNPRLHGVDYNLYMAAWCRRNLPFAEFDHLNPSEQLPYEDEAFAFIYSYSVFTHLDQEAHDFWVQELQRVLRPGGFLYLTLRGERYAEFLSAEERERFDAGEMVVQAQNVSGSNACLAHHPESYVRERLAPEMSLVDLIPSDKKGERGDPWLDIALFTKPG
jgi:SAM-dependent methyltransferase